MRGVVTSRGTCHTLPRVDQPLLVPTNTKPSHVAPSHCLHVEVVTPKAMALRGQTNQVRIADGSQIPW